MIIRPFPMEYVSLQPINVLLGGLLFVLCNEQKYFVICFGRNNTSCDGLITPVSPKAARIFLE
jgi:hypothetical protein